ncbi:MAG: alpha/beta fold hydrolase [Halioglobus sp.]
MKNWRECEFELGDFPLDNGDVLSNGKLYYHQLGALNAPKNNLILMPTYYGGKGISNRAWVDDLSSPFRAQDFCVVIPCLFGAGESSSPSNAGSPQAGPHFPSVSLADNVRAQRELLRARFLDAGPRLVMGWSMGGMQAIQWAHQYPDRVGSVLAICATAKCYPHNRVFLEGVASALMADADFNGGHYVTPPNRGLTAFAKVYAGWAYSQAFYRAGLYRELGFASIDELLAFWVQDHLQQDANDLLVQLRTWQNGDATSSATPGGALVEPFSCPAIFMPSSSDLYFTAADARDDAQALGADCLILESDFGHIAGGPGRLPAETRKIFKAVECLLAKTQ